jgi:hypothetical protein
MHNDDGIGATMQLLLCNQWFHIPSSIVRRQEGATLAKESIKEVLGKGTYGTDQTGLSILKLPISLIFDLACRAIGYCY